eukprot:78569_1
MRSTYEFGIYLTHFCNVDLFRQGLYFFRIGLYTKTNSNEDLTKKEKKEDINGGDEKTAESKHFALPYRTMMGKQHERDFLIRSSDRIESMGHIDDVTSTYCSSVFRVQFQEQKVRLNEGCLFRLDLEYERKHRVYIDVELVFCELHASDYKNAGFPTFEEFTIVDKTTLCSVDCYGGIHSMYPVSFSTAHFCLVHVMVHAELINFKLIPPPPHYKLIAKYEKEKDEVKATTNGISTNLSFAESVFSANVDCIASDSDWLLVSKHHLFYVYCLLCSYKKLGALVDEYIDSYLSESNVSHLCDEFDALYPVRDVELSSCCKIAKCNCQNHQSFVMQALINCDSSDVLRDEYEALRVRHGIVPIMCRFSGKERSTMTGREICHLIGEDVHAIAGQLFRIWHFFLSLIPFLNGKLMTKRLLSEWQNTFVERWGAAIFRETLTQRARLRVVSTSLSEHEMISRKVRGVRESTLSQLEAPPLQDIVYMIGPSQQAVIFEQTYNDCTRHKQPDKCRGKHVFVLVHGYQGNSWDMRMFRNHLLVQCPSDLFLLSEANESEGATEGDIGQMGQRLAQEIVTFIDTNVIQQQHKLCRISFITHSLGGIIAREACTNSIFVASPYSDKCYTFISLAVCHCGYLFGRSKALQAGFYLMRSWKKSLCLQQLSLTDHENPRKTFLYKLSKKESLRKFRNVLLVSSPEDRYTPYHSTRIEMHRKTVQDTKWGRIYNEMVRNLLRPLDHVNLTRFDVSFSLKQKSNSKINIDSMIGRSAHICFLEQPLYIDMLIHVYKKYFVPH